MRKSGLILSAAGLGAFVGTRVLEKRFTSLPGKVATTLSRRMRARRDLVQAGGRVALRTAIAGLVLFLIPKRG